LIWGVGDPHLIPRVIDRAKKGRLVKVGQGGNRVDLTHVENAAHAHVLACEAMEPQSPVAGNCYFVSDDHPVDLWLWIDELLTALSLPGVKWSLSLPAAKWIGGILESVYHNFNISGEPPMTRFLACQLATSHYFNISRAKKDFGYQPVMTPEQGMQDLIQSYQADR